MAAPENALCGTIYNAVDSQTQDEIIQDLHSQIQELMRQPQAALAHLSSPTPLSPAPIPTQTLSPPAPAEESMNTAPSAASSRASSPLPVNPRRNADHPPPTPSPHTSMTSFAKQPASWSRSNSASCPASHDLKSV
ncbi:hypothetical protein MRX96_014110 [Rhipicephalus microplus]